MVGQRKVSNACQRCKRQKLKCDVQRPCVPCSRASVDCKSASQTNKWRVFKPEESQRKTRKQYGKSKGKYGDSKNRRDAAQSTSPVSAPGNTTSPRTDRWNSSSAASLLMQAFKDHEKAMPEESTSAFLIQTTQLKPRRFDRDIANSYRSFQRQRSRHLRVSNSTFMYLKSLLPSVEVAHELVEVYFDRIHWFTLVFHQTEFRQNFRDLYDELSESRQSVGKHPEFISVLIAVLALSLQYAAGERKQRLIELKVDIQAEREKLLTALRTNLLDIASILCIEAVQTCVLLGSYYLYHGEPELAWPICGCGLRIAQALNLHRQMEAESKNRYLLESQKRCWWTIYEIETFCSMLYGFPLGITDRDCDIDLMNPYDPSSSAVSGKQGPEATMLSYKRCMSQLSVIVKSILADLYSSRQDWPLNPSSRLQHLLNKAESFDKTLREFYKSIPIVLCIPTAAASASQFERSTNSTQSESYIFRVQALSLKLAYENARILVHRSILSYKRTKHTSGTALEINDRLKSSSRACQDAALQISNLGSVPGFQETSHSYAVAFVSVHLLTAGITLCIMTSLAPLSPESQECKVAIQRLMDMQSFLKNRSIVAKQGHEVMTKLVRLVMEKEMKVMIGPVPSIHQKPASSPADNDHLVSRASNDEKRISISPLDNREEAAFDDAAVTENGDPGQHAQYTENVLDSEFPMTLDFEEDLSMTQTLLEFGLISGGESQPPNEDGFGLFGDYSLLQDQGWIWDFNHSL